MKKLAIALVLVLSAPVLAEDRVVTASMYQTNADGERELVHKIASVVGEEAYTNTQSYVKSCATKTDEEGNSETELTPADYNC